MAAVTKDVLKAGTGPAVTKTNRYKAMVTLSIEAADGTLTPSGWSTRVEHGAARDEPFAFQPGVNLIAGWTEGVLLMVEGERAKLHVPSSKGYGSSPQGSPGGGWYIPGNSNLCFDIEIIGTC